MNIICNNCVGARLYEVTNQQFPNPFMWSAIKWKDFIKLVNNFEKFDFNNPIFELETYLNNEYQTVLVTLNNIVKIHYIHYIQDDTKETPVKENFINILYKDILSYAKEKWFKRLNRSLEEPTFIFSFNYMKPDSEKYMRVFNELLKINKKIIILLHESVKIEQDVPSNIELVFCNNDIMKLNGAELAIGLKNIIFK